MRNTFSLESLVELFHTHLQITHDLWTFAIVAYVGILGLVFGNRRIGESYIARLWLTFFLMVFAFDNYVAIEKSQYIMLACKESVFDLINMEGTSLHPSLVDTLEKLRVTSIPATRLAHFLLDAFVLAGLWIPEFANLIGSFQSKKKKPTKLEGKEETK